MRIEIVSISEPEFKKKGTRSWQEVSIEYNNAGKKQVKKLLSFDPIFAVATKLKVGDTVEVTSVKEGDFWKWTEIKPTQTSNATSSGRVTGSNYETPEERAKKQVYIVRQSSIANAITLLEQMPEVVKSTEIVLELASKFEKWVFRGIGNDEDLEGVVGFEDFKGDEID